MRLLIQCVVNLMDGMYEACIRMDATSPATSSNERLLGDEDIENLMMDTYTFVQSICTINLQLSVIY